VSGKIGLLPGSTGQEKAGLATLAIFSLTEASLAIGAGGNMVDLRAGNHDFSSEGLWIIAWAIRIYHHPKPCCSKKVPFSLPTWLSRDAETLTGLFISISVCTFQINGPFIDLD